MKLADLKKKKGADLKKVIADERKALRELRFSLAAGKTSKSHEATMHRKTIARALTLIKQEAAQQ